MRIPTDAATTLPDLREAVSRKAIAAGSFVVSPAAGRPAASQAAAPGDTVAVAVPSPTILLPDTRASVFGSPPSATRDTVGSQDVSGRPVATASTPGATASAPAPPPGATAGSPAAPSTVGPEPEALPIANAEALPSGVELDSTAAAQPTADTSGTPLPMLPSASGAEPSAPAAPPGAEMAPRAPDAAPTREPALPAAGLPANAAPQAPGTSHRDIPARGAPAERLVDSPGPALPAPPAAPASAARLPRLPATGGLPQCRVSVGDPSPVAGASIASPVLAAGVGEVEVAAAVDALLAEKGKLPGALAAAHASIRNGSVEALLYGKARAPSPPARPETLIAAGDDPGCSRPVGAPRVDFPAPAPAPGRSAVLPSPLARPEAEGHLGDALVAALPLLRAPQTFERLVDGVRRALVAPEHADGPSAHAAPGLPRATALYGRSPPATASTRSVAVDEDAYASERLAFSPRTVVWNEAAAVRAQIEHELAQRDRRPPRRRAPSLAEIVGGALHDLVDALFDEAVHLCNEGSGSSRSLLGELVEAARAIASRVVQRHGTAFDRLVPGGITAPLVDALLGEILGGVPVASRRALLVLVSAPRVESAATLLMSAPPANTSALVAVAPEIAPFAHGIGARMASASAGIASLVVYTLVGRADLLTPCADPVLVRARTRRLLAELAELEAAA